MTHILPIPEVSRPARASSCFQGVEGQGSTRWAVQDADALVLIAGFRYGSPMRGRAGPSYTELEHETAEELGIPRLVFLLDEATPG